MTEQQKKTNNEDENYIAGYNVGYCVGVIHFAGRVKTLIKELNDECDILSERCERLMKEYIDD